MGNDFGFSCVLISIYSKKGGMLSEALYIQCSAPQWFVILISNFFFFEKGKSLLE
jgi:hypothetical protein